MFIFRTKYLQNYEKDRQPRLFCEGMFGIIFAISYRRKTCGVIIYGETQNLLKIDDKVTLEQYFCYEAVRTGVSLFSSVSPSLVY